MRSFPFVFAVIASMLTLPSSADAEETSDASPTTPPAGIAGRGVELAPYYGVMVVPQSLSLGFVGVDLTYRLGDHFALGVDGAWYKPFDQPEAPNPTTPISVTLTSVDLDFVYFPWPRSAPGHRAGAFEPFVLAGVGTVVTRPVAVVDPVDRHFDDTVEIALSPGLGARVFWHVLARPRPRGARPDLRGEAGGDDEAERLRDAAHRRPEQPRQPEHLVLAVQ